MTRWLITNLCLIVFQRFIRCVIFRVQSTRTVLRDLNAFRNRRLRTGLLVRVRFVNVVTGRLIQGNRLSCVVVQYRTRYLRVNARFRRLCRSTYNVLLKDGGTFRLGDLRCKAISDIGNTNVSVLRLLLLRRDRCASKYARVLTSNGGRRVRAIRQRCKRNLLIHDISSGNYNGLFLRAVRPTSTRIHACRFIPRYEGLFYRRIAVVPWASGGVLRLVWLVVV